MVVADGSEVLWTYFKPSGALFWLKKSISDWMGLFIPIQGRYFFNRGRIFKARGHNKEKNTIKQSPDPPNRHEWACEIRRKIFIVRHSKANPCLDGLTNDKTKNPKNFRRFYKSKSPFLTTTPPLPPHAFSHPEVFLLKGKLRDLEGIKLNVRQLSGTRFNLTRAVAPTLEP